jgi:thioredoxin-like negative regulator of GroEL
MKVRAVPFVFLLGIASLTFAYDKDAGVGAADQAFAQGRYSDAFGQFKRLSRKDPACWLCYIGMGRSQLGMGDAAKAHSIFDDLLKRSEDKGARAMAHRFKAEAYLITKDTAHAESELRAAIAEQDSAHLHFLLGLTLMKMERDDQGKAEIQRFLAAPNVAELVPVARKYLENPDRARQSYAPDLTFRALDGEEWSLERLHGRVVVMDFWATWCPPCRASVGELKDLVKKYPADRLVLISISADDDDKEWREYVASHKMNWVHYRDRDKSVLKAFGVQAFPTYMIIDGNGVIRKQLSGANPQMSLAGRIKDVLKEMPELQATASAR